LANVRLDRPLEVVRHALALLATGPTTGRAEAHAQVKVWLEEARVRLAVIAVDALPSDLQPMIDGAPPQLTHLQRIYVSPGEHVLELRKTGVTIERASIHLTAGRTVAWPRTAERESVVAGTLQAGAETSPQSRQPSSDRSAVVLLKRQHRATLAWTSGIAGGLSAMATLAVYAAAEKRARALADDHVERLGYPDDADDYGRLKRTIIPMALVSGALMATGVALSPKLSARGSRAWSISSLVLGGALSAAGAFLLAWQPATLVHGTEIERPGRERGALVLSCALPLVVYGLTFLVKHSRKMNEHVRTDPSVASRARIESR
jgi:hypothetical protein